MPECVRWNHRNYKKGPNQTFVYEKYKIWGENALGGINTC